MDTNARQLPLIRVMAEGLLDYLTADTLRELYDHGSCQHLGSPEWLTAVAADNLRDAAIRFIGELSGRRKWRCGTRSSTPREFAPPNFTYGPPSSPLAGCV